MLLLSVLSGGGCLKRGCFFIGSAGFCLFRNGAILSMFCVWLCALVACADMAELVDVLGLGPSELCSWGFKSLYPHSYVLGV